MTSGGSTAPTRSGSGSSARSSGAVLDRVVSIEIAADGDAQPRKVRRLNHVLVINQRYLHRIPTRYLVYYHRARTHLALDKDAPDIRLITLPAAGKIVELPEVGGLQHRYIRQAA